MKNKITYIVDDDKLTIRLMTLIIQKNKFCEEISSFNHAQKALDHLQEHAGNPEILPDVILLDLNMPVLDGWQFLEEFSRISLYKTISIFIVTSSIDPNDIAMAKNNTMIKGYIMKPITAQKLAEATALLTAT